MIVKLPAAYDVSHHKEIRNFKLVSPRPVLFITKASEDIRFVDSKFVRFASGMMELECTRGFYHFNRKAYGGDQQALHFLKTISQIDILPTDFLILDVEEGGEKASQLWAWFDRVQEEYPNNRVMLYGRKNLLDPIIMTQSERDYFKQIPTWPAGYPFYPDQFSKIPVGYTPDQTKYGESWLWQYASHGRVDGITTELGDPTDVDLNWISPKLYALIGDSVNLGEKTMANYTGEVTSATPAKVWDKIGGARTYPDLGKGTKVLADAKQGEYVHLTSPRAGWSKSVWFSLTEITTPPPPPPPPSEEYILHVKDGVARKFIPE